MRRLAALPLILLTVPALAQSKLTPEACENLVGPIEALTKFTLNGANRISAADHRPLAKSSTGQIRDTAERAEIARQNLLEAMSEYGDATDALAYQLRVCAR